VLCTTLLAACGSTRAGPSAGQPSAPSTPPATLSTSGTPATPAASATASASPAASGAAASGAAARCATSSLTVTVDVKQGSAAAGSAYYPIDFTNTGSSPCRLSGYPGVSFVTGSKAGKNSSLIGAPASRNSGAPAAAVTLPAGGAAHAVLQVVDAGNYSPSACHPVTAHSLRVYPPGQAAPAYASFTVQVCSAKLPANLGSPLAVYPVRGGKGTMGQAP
jgi:hypothetical protein